MNIDKVIKLNKDLIKDLLKILTMHVCLQMIIKNTLNDSQWRSTCFSSLIGFVVYHVLICNIINLNKFDNVTNETCKNILKYVVMIIVSRIVLMYSIDEECISQLIHIIFCFIIYFSVVNTQLDKYIDNKKKKTIIQDILLNLFILSMVQFTSSSYSFKSFDKDFCVNTSCVIVGFTIFNVLYMS